jgi:DNA-binding transcriptional LysR family regulator
VAKEGSFTKAGKVLQISQPSVSSLVISLQKELGVKLFEKLGEKPRLTEAGRRLLKLAETTLTTVDRIPQEIESIKGLKKGTFKVGGSALAGATILPKAVQEFKKKYPGVDVVLRIQRSESLEKKLLEGELDLAILGREPESSLLVRDPYRDVDIVVIAPPNHPLTKKRSVSLEDLAKEALITEEKGTRIRDMVERRFTSKRLPFAPVLEVDVEFGNRDTIRNAVERGLGLGFISECHVLGDIKAGHLKILKVPDLKLKRTMYIAVHKKCQTSSLVRAFIELLRQLNH